MDWDEIPVAVVEFTENDYDLSDEYEEEHDYRYGGDYDSEDEDDFSADYDDDDYYD